MRSMKSWIFNPFKKFFQKRLGPTPDEQTEFDEIERIANEVFEHFA